MQFHHLKRRDDGTARKSPIGSTNLQRGKETPLKEVSLYPLKGGWNILGVDGRVLGGVYA